MKMSEYGRIVIINGTNFYWPKQIDEIKRFLSINHRPMAELYVHGEAIMCITVGNGPAYVDDAIRVLKSTYENYRLRPVNSNTI